MTRRERMENRVAKRREWASKAAQRSEVRFKAVQRLCDSIPLGQPILVGHHSERHARADAKRIHNGMRAALDLDAKAKNHTSKAFGIADQLERSIFSDDDNAIEALRAKIAAMEADRAQRAAENKAFRKALKACGGDKAKALAALAESGEITRDAALTAARLFALCPYEKAMHPPYELSNLGGRIRAARERIKEIEARNARTAAAAEAGGMLISGEGERCTVTFDEFPGRRAVDALKAAGFFWSGGSWHGRREALPAL